MDLRLEALLALARLCSDEEHADFLPQATGTAKRADALDGNQMPLADKSAALCSHLQHFAAF